VREAEGSARSASLGLGRGAQVKEEAPGEGSDVEEDQADHHQALSCAALAHSRWGPQAPWRQHHGLRQGRWPRGTGSTATALTSATQRMQWPRTHMPCPHSLKKVEDHAPALPLTERLALAPQRRPAPAAALVRAGSEGTEPQRRTPQRRPLQILSGLLGLVRTWRGQHVRGPQTLQKWAWAWAIQILPSLLLLQLPLLSLRSHKVGPCPFVQGGLSLLDLILQPLLTHQVTSGAVHELRRVRRGGAPL